MKIKLDFNSEKSIYLQIKDNILKGIATGQISTGESLPSVRNLSESIGVNLHTVSKAYNELKYLGFLNIDRRKGAVIPDLPLKKNDSISDDINEKAEILIYESFLSGVDKKSFISMCEKIYDECEVSKND